MYVKRCLHFFFAITTALVNSLCFTSADRQRLHAFQDAILIMGYGVESMTTIVVPGTVV
jgi:hypothetical protein